MIVFVTAKPVSYRANETMGVFRYYNNRPYSIIWKHREPSVKIFGSTRDIDNTFIIHTGKMGFRIK